MQLLAWVTSILLFVEFFDTTILYVCSVPIANEFGVTATNITQPVLSYIIGTCLFIPMISWLIKRIDRYTIIHLSIITFALSSLICGVSQSLLIFSLARFAQGAAISVASSVLIMMLIETYRQTSLVRLMAMINILALVGAGLGPLMGAVFTNYLTWRIAFLINLPVCLFSAILLYAYSRLNGACIQEKSQYIPFDLIGYVLLAGFLLCSSFGLEWLSQHIDSMSILYLIVAISFLAAYIIHWLRSTQSALLSLKAFSDINFVYGFSINLIVRLAASGFPMLMGIYLQQGVGLSVIQTGMYLSIIALASIAAKCCSKWISHIGIHRSITLCSVLAAITMLMMQDINLWISWRLLWVPFACYGLIVSMLYTAMNAVCFVSIHRELIPDASNIVTIMQQFCIGLGVALAVGGYQYFTNRVSTGMLFNKVSNQMLHAYHVINMFLAICMLSAACFSFVISARYHLKKLTNYHPVPVME